MKDKILIIVAIASIIGGIAAITYVLWPEKEPETEEEVVLLEEPTTQSPERTSEVARGGITTYVYGGLSDIKTHLSGNTEFALIRNPSNIGGLELAIIDEGMPYFFALDSNGNKIPFSEGSPAGLHGYREEGLVSGVLIQERITDTEYFIAYPDATSARLASMEEIPDTGIANQFLATQVAKITNINTGRSVVAEIDHRSSRENAVLMSRAVLRELGLQNGSTGNLTIELFPKESLSIGPVR